MDGSRSFPTAYVSTYIPGMSLAYVLIIRIVAIFFSYPPEGHTTISMGCVMWQYLFEICRNFFTRTGTTAVRTISTTE